MAEDNKPAFDWQAITPEDSPRTPMDVHADPRHQDLATANLKPGDYAYDFERQIYDYSSGREVATSESFHLSIAAREKPVALVFGSYT
jgi:hypothetical protein